MGREILHAPDEAGVTVDGAWGHLSQVAQGQHSGSFQHWHRAGIGLRARAIPDWQKHSRRHSTVDVCADRSSRDDFTDADRFDHWQRIRRHRSARGASASEAPNATTARRHRSAGVKRVPPAQESIPAVAQEPSLRSRSGPCLYRVVSPCEGLADTDLSRRLVPPKPNPRLGLPLRGLFRASLIAGLAGAAHATPLHEVESAVAAAKSQRKPGLAARAPMRAVSLARPRASAQRTWSARRVSLS